MSHSLALLFAQVTNAAAAAAPGAPDPNADTGFGWRGFLLYGLLLGLLYFAFFRPQIQAKKKQEETIRGAKTGDRIVTSSGIHGVITNVKDTTVIVKVADNVKLEVEKSHIDKITRETADADKTVAAKA